MTLYSTVLFIHVVTAVLGLGQVSTIALLAKEPSSTAVNLIPRLLGAGSGSLGVMLLSGLYMLWEVHGSFASTWWFSISMVLFLFLGFLLGMGRRTARTMTAPDSRETAIALAKLRRLGGVMSATIAAIVYLMEAKPF